MSRTHTADLPGLYVRSARQIAFTALILDILAIAEFFLLTKMLGFVTIAIGIGFALLALVTSIAGIVVSRRCLSPQPQGAIGTLILSMAIIGGYIYVTYQLAGLVPKH